MASRKEVLDEKEKIARQLAQNLRNDFHLLSNEAKKKYPSVKEVTVMVLYNGRHFSFSTRLQKEVG